MVEKIIVSLSMIRYLNGQNQISHQMVRVLLMAAAWNLRLPPMNKLFI